MRSRSTLNTLNIKSAYKCVWPSSVISLEIQHYYLTLIYARHNDQTLVQSLRVLITLVSSPCKLGLFKVAHYIIVVNGVEPGDEGGACMATSWP